MSSPYRPSNNSPFGPERYTGRRDTALFLGAVLIATTFLLGPPRWGEATAATIRSTVLVPFLWLQAQAEDGRNLRARFVAVESQRDSVAWDAQAIPALRAENQRLRSLLGMTERITVPYRTAEVLRQSQITDGRTLVVSIGSRSGVQSFDPVVSPEGLVGAVLTADPTTSIVMTWAHPEFRVSAATEDGSVLGLVAAAQTEVNSEPLLELRGVPYSDTVASGTLVVTTGLGGIYPQGVPIGRVLGVAREQRGWERIYLVRPLVNLGAVGHVLVLGRQTAAGVVIIPPPAAKPAVESVAPAPSVRRRQRVAPADTTAPRPVDTAVPRPADTTVPRPADTTVPRPADTATRRRPDSTRRRPSDTTATPRPATPAVTP